MFSLSWAKGLITPELVIRPNKSNFAPEWDSPGIVVYQTTWANGDHHVRCGDVMEACVLGVFEVTVR